MKRFDVATEPVEFELAGDVYRALGDLPVSMVDELEMSAETKPIDWSLRFLRAVLLDEDRGRFDALVESRTTIVSARVVAEIVEWLVDGYLSGFPTLPPSSSSTGGAGNGDGSPGTSSSEASTQAA